MPHEKRLEWVRTDLLDYAEKAIFPRRVHASTDAPSPFDICAESHSRCDILDRENPAWFKSGGMRVTRSDWRAGGVSPLFSLPHLHLCQQGADAPRSPTVTCV